MPISSTSSFLGFAPSRGSRLSLNVLKPVYIINSATTIPAYASRSTPLNKLINMQIITTEVDMQSESESAEAAFIVAESIILPSFLLNSAIQSLTSKDAPSTPTASQLNSDGSGEKIFSTELFPSSKPIIIIMHDIIIPDTYSILP